MAEPDNVESFASKMIAAVADPDLAHRVGMNGRRVCEELLDYKKYSAPLVAFFQGCMRINAAPQTSEAERKPAAD
jgi:hypothetical protein